MSDTTNERLGQPITLSPEELAGLRGDTSLSWGLNTPGEVVLAGEGANVSVHPPEVTVVLSSADLDRIESDPEGLTVTVGGAEYPVRLDRSANQQINEGANMGAFTAPSVRPFTTHHHDLWPSLAEEVGGIRLLAVTVELTEPRQVTAGDRTILVRHAYVAFDPERGLQWRTILYDGQGGEMRTRRAGLVDTGTDGRSLLVAEIEAHIRGAVGGAE